MSICIDECENGWIVTVDSDPGSIGRQWCAETLTGLQEIVGNLYATEEDETDNDIPVDESELVTFEDFGGLSAPECVEQARLAIKGKNYALGDAFSWSKASQGFDFWGAEDDGVIAGNGLSPKAAAILKASIAKWEAGNA